MAVQDKPDFDFEFYSEVAGLEQDLKPEAERRLRELANGHRDMVGAAVAVEQPAASRKTRILRRRR
jgi:hypothetical protein